MFNGGPSFYFFSEDTEDLPVESRVPEVGIYYLEWKCKCLCMVGTMYTSDLVNAATGWSSFAAPHS